MPELSIAPPLPAPFRKVIREAVKLAPPAITNTRLALFPLIEISPGPGPSKMTLMETGRCPLVSVMVWPWIAAENWMISPESAEASVARNEPGPLSLALVTVSVAACAEATAKRARIATSQTFHQRERRGGCDESVGVVLGLRSDDCINTGVKRETLVCSGESAREV